MTIDNAMHTIMKDVIDSLKEQPIPDCLAQFSLDWRSKEYRDSKYFPFAAGCKGMTTEEYGRFLDEKLAKETKEDQ